MSPPGGDILREEASSSSRVHNLRSRRKEGGGDNSLPFSSPRVRANGSSTPATPALLPTTAGTPDPIGASSYQSATRRHIPGTSTAPYNNNNSCNSFLLGGSYYPGKDKKRRHMRKKALWYRIFCSSPWRSAIATLTVAYIAVWHILIPFASLMLYYGAVLSSSGRMSSNGLGTLGAGQREHGEEWLLNHYRLPFTLPMLEDERAAVQNLVQKRQAQNGERAKARRQILQKIVPEWLHRNEYNADKQQQRIQHVADKAYNIQDRHNQKDIHRNAKEEVTSNDEASEQQQEKKKYKLDDNHHVKWHAPALSRPIRTLQNMNTYPNESKCSEVKDIATLNDIHISLVVQASFDRVWVLDETCRRWRDPIVAVVGLTVAEQSRELSSALAGWEDKCPQLQLIFHKLDEEQARPENYPVNHLRNVALDAVETSHILVVDVDFVPSDKLDDTIRATLEERQRLRQRASTQGIELPKEEMDALVVPAFERVLDPPCTTEDECARGLRESSSFIPESFEDLKSCVGKKECIVFQSDVNWEGHYSTRSEEWLRGNWYENNNSNNDAQDIALLEDSEKKRDRAIKSIKCFDTLRYEPYVVLKWCGSADSNRAGQEGQKKDPKKSVPMAPYYDERYHGYGKNVRLTNKALAPWPGYSDVCSFKRHTYMHTYSSHIILFILYLLFLSFFIFTTEN